MSTLPSGTKISAIVPTEKELEDLVNDLLETKVNRHQISIQGSPMQMSHSFGKPYVNPEVIKHSNQAPTTEPFLSDDFGWVLGFAFSIPFVIGIILGIFVIGDLFSISDNFLYGSLGGFIGALVGALFAFLLKKHKDRKTLCQEKQGGFVIWIQVDSEEQVESIIPVLIKHHARQIEPDKGSWLSEDSCPVSSDERKDNVS